MFAEVKIKHLRRLPLPEGVARRGECTRLNRLGAARAELERKATEGVMEGAALVEERLRLEREIEEEVERLLGLGSAFNLNLGRVSEERRWLGADTIRGRAEGTGDA